MSNTLLVVIFGVTPVIIMLILTVLILMRITGTKNRENEKLRQELRYEIDRSRQETIEMVQSSVRNLGNVITANQRESTDIQSRHLAEMNKQMGDSLRQVSRGLGEMQNLAVGVDDLRKVLSNVKTRGILGEIQLGAILEQILAPDQYEENVAVTGTSERVEFAVKFPGEGSENVYLPIDSKFPADAYSNLLDAYDTGDKLTVKAATDNLKNAILKAAKDIRNKYVLPPYTTEFGIMFLPFEGLYAEVLRLGMVERLQQDYRVTIAGPTNMAAMLNSFQMGFRSLALQKQSGQVWDTLAKVRTEFDKFEEVLAKTQNHLNMTQKDLEALVGVRTRGIQKVLNNVEEYTSSDSR